MCVTETIWKTQKIISPHLPSKVKVRMCKQVEKTFIEEFEYIVEKISTMLEKFTIFVA